jgi:hypothetical protein
VRRLLVRGVTLFSMNLLTLIQNGETIQM